MQEREDVIDAAARLAHAVAAAAESARGWEPLRDLVLAGFEAGGLHRGADGEALRRAAGELAAVALSAQRRSASS